MIFEDYKEQVKRTLPSLGSITLDSIHMVLGMCSELYEFESARINRDDVNIAEELTDIAWYASNYCNIRNIDILGLYKLERDQGSLDSSWRLLVNNISELQDYDKKELAYNKIETREIAESRVGAITLVLHCLNNLYKHFNLDPEQAMQNNIDKLRARFPNAFSEFDANNRDLNKERTELEK